LSLVDKIIWKCW